LPSSILTSKNHLCIRCQIINPRAKAPFWRPFARGKERSFSAVADEAKV
jgi:hypothetical protein